MPSAFPSTGPSRRRFPPFPAPPAGRAFVLVVLRDFTQQRRLEEMRADFVANASHELRTPLASVLGFVETLQGPAENDPVARESSSDIMRAQATRMSRLIDDLLSLSRIELNAHVRPDKPVDLATVVGHVADTLAPLALERGVDDPARARTGALVVLGDRDELIRVFENLVENAIKYGASGKRVDITLADASGSGGRPAEAVVTVRDYGPGIAAEHLPRLTERFYRVDIAQIAGQGRDGPRACDRQAHPRPPPWPPCDRKRAGLGRDIHRAHREIPPECLKQLIMRIKICHKTFV